MKSNSIVDQPRKGPSMGEKKALKEAIPIDDEIAQLELEVERLQASKTSKPTNGQVDIDPNRSTQKDSITERDGMISDSKEISAGLIK